MAIRDPRFLRDAWRALGAVPLPAFALAVLSVLGAACATVASHPCIKGGQPAFGEGKVGKGTKQCSQVRDASGAYVNHGKYIEWYPNGVRAIEGEYSGGFKTGKWIEWDEQGRKLGEKWFEAGNEVPGREEKPYNGLGPPPRPTPRPSMAPPQGGAASAVPSSTTPASSK